MAKPIVTATTPAKAPTIPRNSVTS
jgi:hypothetical protein